LDDLVRIEANESANPDVGDLTFRHHSANLPHGDSKAFGHGFDVQEHRDTMHGRFARRLDRERPFLAIRITLRI